MNETERILQLVDQLKTLTETIRESFPKEALHPTKGTYCELGRELENAEGLLLDQLDYIPSPI